MDEPQPGRSAVRATTWRVVPVCLMLFALGGCLAGGGGGPSPSPTGSPPSATPTQSMPAEIDSTLSAYLRADNRTRYAKRHGLTTENDRVRVVIGLRDGATLPSGFDTVVELRSENEVIASVATGDLATLADHRNVTVVRMPDRPRPQGDDGSVEPSDIARADSIRFGGRR
jgi:hypothetical protein